MYNNIIFLEIKFKKCNIYNFSLLLVDYKNLTKYSINQYVSKNILIIAHIQKILSSLNYT